MLIRAYSDLHGFLPRVQPCDVLLIAGDICPIDGAFGDHEPKTQARWLKEVFNPWIEEQPVKYVVLVGGNHDAILDPKYGRGFHFELSRKVSYLLDSAVQIENDGPDIYGQPWIPKLAMWPFFKPDFRLRELAEELSPQTAIWLLHSPPCEFEHGYKLDVVRGEHVGNPFVTPKIIEHKPQLVICGHIHEGFGIDYIGETNIANVAFLDEHYKPRWKHLEIDWDEGEWSVARIEMVDDDRERGLWWSCR